ncbi:multicopper oxidase family protein [Actinomycetospora straminea]|uniref:multicopper oxidase family protein n=1 Tax=Actinomycetospora straminea TaxID=663607 RepID=UPI0023669344|nr:multicopper oxidase family protein [Actinomycetospora straminea]MDD7933054.1 multicopper oxidase family protein [Actinomycetospora straminea]
MAVVAALAILVPVGWLWTDSLVPADYSVAEMGVPDHGGGPAGPAGHAGMHGGVHTGGPAVDQLREPPGPADVDLTLVARGGRVTLPSGRVIDGYTLNGTTPGPEIRAVQGQMVQVRLVNADVAEGVTLHWHGYDVPAGDDGVAGVTQDAVLPGGEFVYRFRAEQAGTFWYHSHQVADPQVKGGLFGALVVTPHAGLGEVGDVPALTHLYDGRRTVNGREGDVAAAGAPGQRVRVRVVNTDNGPVQVWVGGAPYRLVATDGDEVDGPTPSTDSLAITAGGRADLEVDVPADGSGVRVEIGGSSAVTFGAARPPTPRPARELDPLHHGTPTALPFDPDAADRRFDYVIGRRPGFLDGTPGLWWTVNGAMWPDVPMYVVREGDVVRMRIENGSGEVHPMHLHGHHAVVLARDGVPATGSPWWVDSLDVADGHSYDVAFVADNPGLWTDHCHNLAHPAEGLTAHLVYEGVTTPYRAGGHAHNDPE